MIPLLLDENVDERLLFAFPPGMVEHSVARGWGGIVNGELLALASQHGFSALITADKNMAFQQNIGACGVALVVLDIHPSTLSKHKLLAPQIVEMVGTFEAGQVYVIKATGSEGD